MLPDLTRREYPDQTFESWRIMRAPEVMEAGSSTRHHGQRHPTLNSAVYFKRRFSR